MVYLEQMDCNCAKIADREGNKAFVKQSGVALGAILWVIAIMTILGALISTGLNGFNVNTNQEGGKIAAQAIINFTDQVADAVSMVQANGSCNDTQIRFENTNTSGWSFPANYNNPNAPSDGSCDIFNPSITGYSAGGGLNWTAPNPSWLTHWPTAYNGYMYTGSFAVAGVGTCQVGNCSVYSLAVLLPYVTNDICNAINAAVGISINLSNRSSYGSPSSPAVPTFASGAGFEGIYGGYPVGLTSAGTSAFYGHKIGCYQGNQIPNSETTYPNIAYNIILAR